MSQAYITLAATVVGMVVYGGLLIVKSKPIRAEDLLTFAMWCGAIVTGPYMVVSAFRLSKQPGEEANAIYVGIFGAYLFLLAAQKIISMVRRFSSTSAHPTRVSQENVPEKSLK